MKTLKALEFYPELRDAPRGFMWLAGLAIEVPEQTEVQYVDTVCGRKLIRTVTQPPLYRFTIPGEVKADES